MGMKQIWVLEGVLPPSEGFGRIYNRQLFSKKTATLDRYVRCSDVLDQQHLGAIAVCNLHPATRLSCIIVPTTPATSLQTSLHTGVKTLY